MPYSSKKLWMGRAISIKSPATWMAMDFKRTGKPEEFVESQSKCRIERMTVEDTKPECQSVPVPKKRYDGPRRLHSEERIWRQQEWTAEVMGLRTARVTTNEYEVFEFKLHRDS